MAGMVVVAVGFVLVTALMRLIDHVQLHRALHRSTAPVLTRHL